MFMIKSVFVLSVTHLNPVNHGQYCYIIKQQNSLWTAKFYGHFLTNSLLHSQ